jgi:hypothetical protein
MTNDSILILLLMGMLALWIASMVFAIKSTLRTIRLARSHGAVALPGFVVDLNGARFKLIVIAVLKISVCVLPFVAMTMLLLPFMLMAGASGV